VELRCCPSVLSQKFVDKVSLMQDGFSQPRQGRNTVAQGESPISVNLSFQGPGKPAKRARSFSPRRKPWDWDRPLELPQPRQGRYLEKAGRRRRRRTDVAPSGAQRLKFDAPSPTAAPVGHKTPPASRVPRPPRLIRLTPMGESPGKDGPYPLLFPLPRRAGEGGGEGRGPHSPPTAVKV
jgi:hypothetical protein